MSWKRKTKYKSVLGRQQLVMYVVESWYLQSCEGPINSLSIGYFHVIFGRVEDNQWLVVIGVYIWSFIAGILDAYRIPNS